MHLVIDNYDSFTYNVVQYLQIAGANVLVRRNDEITVEEIEKIAPQSIVISPGPCTPDEAGISIKAIRQFYQMIPILGICLGHQCIAQAFGGKITRARLPVHGKASQIDHDGSGLFHGIEQGFKAARYHSLVVSEVPSSLRVIARCRTGHEEIHSSIMALSHNEAPVYGLQFHPESILTQNGIRMIQNFLILATAYRDHLITPVQFATANEMAAR